MDKTIIGASAVCEAEYATAPPPGRRGAVVHVYEDGPQLDAYRVAIKLKMLE